MKSSTTFRSMLSKESIDVIGNLAQEHPIENDIIAENNTNETYSENAPEEYVRTQEEQDDNKSKEIDLLWQTFKSAQFNSNSPAGYIITGIIIGSLITVGIFMMLGAFGLDKKGNMFGIFAPKSHVESVAPSSPNTSVNASIVATNENIQEESSKAENKIADEAETTETKAKAESKPIDLKNTKKYIIKDGDTVEAIIKHHYGAYTPERAQNIMKANNLNNRSGTFNSYRKIGS